MLFHIGNVFMKGKDKKKKNYEFLKKKLKNIRVFITKPGRCFRYSIQFINSFAISTNFLCFIRFILILFEGSFSKLIS